jgi:hypothetical protein
MGEHVTGSVLAILPARPGIYFSPLIEHIILCQIVKSNCLVHYFALGIQEGRLRDE